MTDHTHVDNPPPPPVPAESELAWWVAVPQGPFDPEARRVAEEVAAEIHEGQRDGS